MYEEKNALSDQGKEYIAETAKEGLWKIFAPPENYRVKKNGRNLNLNGTSDALAKKQTIVKLGSNHELIHQRNIHFFAQNWNQLVDIFYTAKVSDLENFQSFTEVELGNSYGRADFIGVGPDHLFVIEFGASRTGKSKQVNTQVDGIRSLASKASNMSLSHDRIVPLVVQYRTIGEKTILDILPPNSQTKSMKKSAEIFQREVLSVTD